jgi:hypothetical protein
MIKKVSLAELEKIAAEKGFKPAPPDHPIYSEGATVTFINYDRNDSNRSTRNTALNTSEENNIENRKIEGNIVDLGPVDIDLRPGYSFSSNIWIRVLKDNKYEISMLAENDDENYEFDDDDSDCGYDGEDDGDEEDSIIEVVGEFTEEEAIEYLDDLGLEFPFK